MHTIRRYEPRAILAKEGEAGCEAFLIRKGKVAVHAEAQEKKSYGVCTVGDIVGEIALIDRCKRSATLTALDDVEVEIITVDDFRLMLNSCHPIVQAVMKGLSRRLRDADLRMSS